MRMTQKELILEYLARFKSITPMDAFNDLGITKLSTRISEMEQDGIHFKHIRESSKNRFGKTVNYMRYEREETL